jgi:Holliday junction resolvasome RuvABC endonuclease subunit
MILLALDLGSRTGYAHTKGDGAVISHGYIDLADKKDPQPARRFINLNSFLTDFSNTKTQEIRIVYEAPHMRGFAATFSLMGLAAVVEMWAARNNFPRPKRVHSATIKKHVTGNGRATKEDVIKAVNGRLLGKAPLIGDDNEADAVALLMYAADNDRGDK